MYGLDAILVGLEKSHFQIEKVVEAVGIEPTFCTFPFAGFAFIEVLLFLRLEH